MQAFECQNPTMREQSASQWGDGPWMAEPDYMQWLSRAGVPVVAIRSHSGAWCGYAATWSGHPWYGADYEALVVAAHGGLTFSGDVLHVRQIVGAPGISHRFDYWLGFDCAHAYDLIPGLMIAAFGGSSVYRDVEFIRAECEALAGQVRAVAEIRGGWPPPLAPPEDGYL